MRPQLGGGIGSSPEGGLTVLDRLRKVKYAATIGIARKINPVQSRLRLKNTPITGSLNSGLLKAKTTPEHILINPGRPHRNIVTMVMTIPRFLFSMYTLLDYVRNWAPHFSSRCLTILDRIWETSPSVIVLSGF